MRIKRLIFAIYFLFLSMSVACAFQVDNVYLDLKEGEMVVSGPKGEIVRHTFYPSTLDYEYILETPYFYLGGYDGIIEIEKSTGIKPFQNNLTKENLVKFPFFSRENTTIGILIGEAGATGRSHQDIYFIDTLTGNFIKIHLTDMQEATWIMEGGIPVGYKGYDTTAAFGPAGISWGSSVRIESIVFFDSGGNLTFDEDLLRSIYQDEYSKIIFSEDEKLLLQENIMREMEHRNLGKKLVDFVFYGCKSGNDEEVFSFLGTLNPVYTIEAEFYR